MTFKDKEKPQNQNTLNKVKILFIACLIFVICLTSTFFIYREQLTKASFWWPILNIKIAKLLGSKLQCSRVYWCNELELCAEQCKTEDGITFIKSFSISLMERKVTAKEWGLNSISPRLSNRKNFPRIPLIIKKIDLIDGDLQAISRSIPIINRVNLQRNGVVGQIWNIHSIIDNENITVNGLTGDSSDLQIQIEKFQILTPKYSSTLKGSIQLRNKLFKQAPVDIDFKNIKLSQNLIQGIPVSDLSLSGRVEFDKSFSRILNLKDFNLQSDEIHLYTDPQHKVRIFDLHKTAKLILRPVDLKKLRPYLPLIPTQSNYFDDYKLTDLSGSLSAIIDLNLSKIEKTKSFLSFDDLLLSLENKDMKIIKLGRFSGDIKFNGKEIKSLSLNIQAQFLKGFEQLLKKKNVQIEKGLFSGKLQYRQKEDLLGNFTINDLAIRPTSSLGQLPSNIYFTKGNGSFNLQNGSLKGSLDTLLGDRKNNLINCDVHLDLPKNFSARTLSEQINGSIKISSPILLVDEIKLNKPFVSMKGGIQKLFIKLGISEGELHHDELSAEANNLYLDLKDKENKNRTINFQRGKFNLLKDKSKEKLLFKNIFATLSGEEKLELNGEIKVFEKADEPQKRNLRAKNKLFSANLMSKSFSIEDLNFKANAKLKTILELYQNLQKNKETNYWMNCLQNPTGYLNGEFEFVNSKLKSSKTSIHNAGINYNGSQIKKINGQILLEAFNNWQINDLNFQLKDKSSLKIDGQIVLKNNFQKSISLEKFKDSISKFKGNLQGLINFNDFIDEDLQKRMNINLSKDFALPIDAEIELKENKMINVLIQSNFKKLGAINPKWVNPIRFDESDFLYAKASINPKTAYFDIPNLECSIKGLNLVAKAKGIPTDFQIAAFTDPIIDLDDLFDPIQGTSIRGALIGWLTNKNVNIFDKESLWEDLKFSLRTDDLQSIEFGPIELRSLESYFEAKDGKGYSTLVVDSGTVNNLGFNDLNVAFSLSNNHLQMPGLTFKTAGGETNLKGEIDLLTATGKFEGKTENVEVGTIARGLSNIRGLSGTGNFTFEADGHLWSLVKGEKPVFGSGSFNLKDGNTSAVVNLQKKLNLANIIFNGPLALNVNSILEILSPTNDGFYNQLSGEWEVDENSITIKNTKYLGKNELNLNMAGFYNKESNFMNFNFTGSIPRIPVRTGTSSNISNAFSQVNIANILGYAPWFKRLFDTNERVFKFNMKGENQSELNQTSSSTFQWLDSNLYSSLPMPNLPNQ